MLEQVRVCCRVSHYPRCGGIGTDLIKLLLRIQCAFTAALTRLDPVSQIPHAAPTTESPRSKAILKLNSLYQRLFPTGILQLGISTVNTEYIPKGGYGIVKNIMLHEVIWKSCLSLPYLPYNLSHHF